MKNITALFYDIYAPFKALTLYRSKRDGDDSIYVEAYDIDSEGKPINATPLSAAECDRLSVMLQDSTELKTSFLQPKGIIPARVLYVCNRNLGYAIWYSPPQTVNLFFKEDLHLPNGKAHVPAMIWKATQDALHVYALKTKSRPDEQTKLYEAPFFNLYEDGEVCMGTVKVELDPKCCLEDFMQTWEGYFWNSKFSHLIQHYSPVKSNIVQLWQSLIGQDKTFPTEILNANGLTLKDIIQ